MMRNRFNLTSLRPLRSASDKKQNNEDSTSSPEGSLDNPKPRSHPDYDRGPDQDGLFYCPYADGRSGSCNHQPTNQRCIYA